MIDVGERVAVLRDEVLDIVGGGDEDSPAVAIFDAIVRALSMGSDTSGGLDLTLHDAVSRRLAWGDTEETILSAADLVYARLARATQRASRDRAAALREDMAQRRLKEALAEQERSLARLEKDRTF